MNILITTSTYFPWITGVSVSTYNIANYLAGQGHSVTIICPKPLVKGEVPAIKNCKVIFLSSFPFKIVGSTPIIILPLAYFQMSKIFKLNKFDIVHIQEPGQTGILSLIFGRKYHLPVVGYLHTIAEQNDRLLWGTTERILTPLFNLYFRFIYNRYDVDFTPSHFFKNNLDFIGVKTPVEVVSNGVETGIFSPKPINMDFRKKYGIPAECILFFYLGRLDGDKNVETIIKAMPYTHKNIRLLIIGKGKLINYIHGLAKKLKVDSKIIWIDYITNEEMPIAYNASDVFTIMSPYEGQSIVTLQGIASGLPVIAASAGALPEICRDGENGFLVHTYDYKALAEKMNQLANDKDLREKFGRESRKISLLHSRPQNFKQLEQIYEKLIKAKAP